MNYTGESQKTQTLFAQETKAIWSVDVPSHAFF